LCSFSRCLFFFAHCYHADVGCANTFNGHSITNTAVEQESATQKKEWYLLVFPPGTVVDNTIFSHHLTFAKKSLIKLHAPANQNGFVEAHHFTPVYWCIAEFGTRKQHGLASNNNQKEDYADT
jgi:hypothetical protein